MIWRILYGFNFFAFLALLCIGEMPWAIGNLVCGLVGFFTFPRK
jgi:hypothetical protein